jgi:hypothetical protein
MAIVTLAVIVGTVVFIVGIAFRIRSVIFICAPAPLLLGAWYFLASSRPNPQKEFDRLFGASNRGLASDIHTIKPTLMDGHFISFHMRATDFDSRVRPLHTEIHLASPPNILLGQPLPAGWPSAVAMAASALHREVEHHDVYLLYFASQEMAYASVRYDQW